MRGDKATGGKPERTAMDWDGLRARMQAAKAASDRAWLPGADESARILHERALALQPEAAQAQRHGMDVIEFGLADERYAVESSHVREVHPLENLTALPCTPAFVRGIVNLRGEIISVIDLRSFLDLAQTGLPDLNKIIVLESASMVFGILADAIFGVRRIALAEIRPALPALTGIRERYLKGITAQRAVMLDAARLLADEAIVVRQCAAP